MSRNLKIGFFALGAAAILIIGINYLKGQDVFFRGRKYYAFYENLQGLTDASRVFYSGYQVGLVREIEIHPEAEASRRFEVTIALTHPLDLPKDSRAEIVSSNILGDKSIELIWGESDEIAESGDELASSVQMGLTEQLGPVKDKAETMIENADAALRSVNAILGGENGKNIEKAVVSLEKTLRELEGVARGMNRLTAENGALTATMVNLDSLTAGLQRADFEGTMGNLNALSENLAKARVDSLSRQMTLALGSLDAILQKADSANNTVGRLLTDPQLYDNLAKSTESLHLLLKDLRENPDRYLHVSVFGGKK